MNSHESLKSIFIFLSAAVLVVPIFRRLGLGAVLGYLVAGFAVGPSGLALIRDVDRTFQFGELGVVMLLFMIGLELKPRQLWELRRPIFGLGGAQVLITGSLLTALGLCFGWGLGASFVAGMSLSFSSTAVALQVLGEGRQLNTSHGRSSFAILLFQDMAAIPLLAIVPLLVRGKEGNADQSPGGLLGVVAVVLLIALGRWPVRHLLRIVAATRTRELLTAISLLLVVGAGYAMTMMGLSMGLGAFLAGVLLADSEYRHEIETDLEPFKGLLLGLFFMAVGMSVDFSLVAHHPLIVGAAVVSLVLIKSIIIYGLSRRAGLDAMASSRMGLVLSQGGEFAFVVFGAASSVGLLIPELRNYLVVTVAFSMAATPLLWVLFEWWVRSRSAQREKVFDEISDESPAVIIAGFGRVGQITGRLLRVLGIPFTALDHDSQQVEVVRRYGHSVYYGDASRQDLLEAAGAAKAKILLLAIDDPESSLATAKMVREKYPHLKLLARARNRQHTFDLMDVGVDGVQRETFESSLTLAQNVLSHLGLSPVETRRAVETFRQHDLEMLRGQHKRHHDEKSLLAFSRQGALQLEELLKSEGAQSAVRREVPPVEPVSS